MKATNWVKAATRPRKKGWYAILLRVVKTETSVVDGAIDNQRVFIELGKEPGRRMGLILDRGEVVALIEQLKRARQAMAEHHHIPEHMMREASFDRTRLHDDHRWLGLDGESGA